MTREWETHICNFNENKRVMESFKERFPFTAMTAGTDELWEWFEHVYNISAGEKYGIFDYGISEHYGWAHIIELFLQHVDKVLREKNLPNNCIRFCRIKEKFGTLCINYTFRHDIVGVSYHDAFLAHSEINKWYSHVKEMSTKTCIHCGAIDNVTMTSSGWIRPYCWNCQQREYDYYYKELTANEDRKNKKMTRASRRFISPHSKNIEVKFFEKGSVFNLPFETDAYRHGTYSNMSSGERNIIENFERDVLDFLLFNDESSKISARLLAKQATVDVGLTSDDDIVNKGQYLKEMIDFIVNEAISKKDAGDK